MQIENKVIIITGASSGIGLATAKLLAAKGAKVALVARTQDKLEELSRQLPGSFVVVADMSNRDDIKIMAEKVKMHYGRIDILINNAGRGYDAPVEKIIPETFQKILDLDVIGPIVAMQQVIPLMRAEGGGAIINVGSGTSLINLPNMSPYASSKRALASISLTAREELKKDNIRVGVVYPYITDTDFEKNTITEGILYDYAGNGLPFPPDSADFAAQKILDAIVSENAETFAHEWMGK